MGCGASKQLPPNQQQPSDASGGSSPNTQVAQTNRELMKMQATGGGSVLLSRREAPSKSAPAHHRELTHDETTATKGGSYIVGKLLKNFALGSGQAPPAIESLSATRQTYIPQPDGAVLRVSYGYSTQCGFNSASGPKVNQDSLLVAERLGGFEHAALFSVFDGHGPRGEDASSFCRHEIVRCITLNSKGKVSSNFKDDPVAALQGSLPKLHDSLVASALSAASGASSAQNTYGSASASIGRAAAKLASAARAAAAGSTGGTGGGADGGSMGGSSQEGSQRTAKAAVPWRSMDIDVSGCTANAVMVLGNSVVCANCGDSRAVLVSSAPPKTSAKGGGEAAPDAPQRDANANPHLGTVKVSALSSDHKPSRSDERARVSRTTAQIISESMLLPGGDSDKLYVCRQEGNSIKYGVLFTRSIGDLDSHTHLGLTAEAEMKTATLRPGVDRFMVLATDGVWDFMSNKEAAKHAARTMALQWKAHFAAEGGQGGYTTDQDAQAAAAALVDTATQRWAATGTGRQDDITAVVVAFKWMTQAEAEEDASAWRASLTPNDSPVEGGAGGFNEEDDDSDSDEVSVNLDSDGEGDAAAAAASSASSSRPPSRTSRPPPHPVDASTSPTPPSSPVESVAGSSGRRRSKARAAARAAEAEAAAAATLSDLEGAEPVQGGHVAGHSHGTDSDLERYASGRFGGYEQPEGYSGHDYDHDASAYDAVDGEQGAHGGL